ncbi:uncharacterized protein LOC105394973 isoform X2 [Plutella xylostella]|uniref:uncharacterized protein LOC105394973 isoform X2 n=1 Tax=Plutella xylostella TaxID=51655 RepID=UPI0020324C11|nr:uncharacterized protein LOC105394973 isoform X2 [Plutella xylostella]
MHFWIDKHSQCTYTGRRRVPTSLSTGVGRGRGRGKPMAAPVHRFAALEPPPRRPRHHRIHNQQVLPAVHARRHPEDPSLYVEIPPSPAQPTIAHIAAARSVTPDTLLRTAALGLHAPMMAPHLKFGMLVSFALATVFLAGAKYYFDRQVSRDASGGEASVVCALVAALAGVGCALSLCRARPPSPVPPERVSSTARHPPHHSQGYTAPPASPPPSPSPRAEAPPPYHIAVLLPDPPAYHALS